MCERGLRADEGPWTGHHTGLGPDRRDSRRPARRGCATRAGAVQRGGKVLKVLGHRQTGIESGCLRHDGDSLANLNAVLGTERMPATMADPEVGAMSVPRVRTVVVLPAPLGPRNPKTSPRATSKDTSENAVRSPKRLVRWLTTRAGSPGACEPAPQCWPSSRPHRSLTESRRRGDWSCKPSEAARPARTSLSMDRLRSLYGCSFWRLK